MELASSLRKAVNLTSRSYMLLGLVLQSIWKTDAGSHREMILRSKATQRRHDTQARVSETGAEQVLESMRFRDDLASKC